MVWKKPLSLFAEKPIIIANNIMFKFMLNTSCQFSMRTNKFGSIYNNEICQKVKINSLTYTHGVTFKDLTQHKYDCSNGANISLFHYISSALYYLYSVIFFVFNLILFIFSQLIYIHSHLICIQSDFYIFIHLINLLNNVSNM